MRVQGGDERRLGDCVEGAGDGKIVAAVAIVAEVMDVDGWTVTCEDNSETLFCGAAVNPAVDTCQV